MKKCILIIITISIILCSLCINVGAISWGNITDVPYTNLVNTNVTKSVLYLRNNLSDDIYSNAYSSSVTMYLTVTVVDANRSSFLGNYIAKSVDAKQKVALVEGADNPYFVYDVTDSITFGASGCIYPTSVYLDRDAYGTDYLQNKYVALSRKQYTGSKFNWWQDPTNYNIDYATFASGTYSQKFKFILKYTLPCENFVSMSANSMFGFLSNDSQFALNPRLLTDGVVSGTPYIGYCLVVPDRITAVFNNPQRVMPRPVLDQNYFYIISSTNLFSPLTYVPELVAPLDGYTVTRTNSKMYHNYIFYRPGNVRVTIDQDYSYNPFVYMPDSEDAATYVYTGFKFDNVETTPYGVKFDFSNITYSFKPLVGTGSKTGYEPAYRYQYNLERSSSADPYNCNDLRFSFITKQSYDELYYDVYANTNVSSIENINLDEFYKDISVKFSTDEGIVKGLSKFFADLFVVTLPNIINNFIVWFMCESPLLSSVTRPIYMIARISGDYLTQWLLPIIASLGGFGFFLVLVFVIKRLIRGIGLNGGGS